MARRTVRVQDRGLVIEVESGGLLCHRSLMFLGNKERVALLLEHRGCRGHRGGAPRKRFTAVVSIPWLDCDHVLAP